MQDNTIDITTRLQDFKDERLRFSVSSRKIQPATPMSFYLKTMFPYCNSAQIENVFGHTVSFSKLYGGRPFIPEHSLTDQHLVTLEKKGIGLSLNLTNHFFDENSYAESLPLLGKHHKKGNSVICTNDQLTRRIKRDFPDYKLIASIIKNLNTLQKIDKALQLYDLAVIPMDKNDDDQFLQAISAKDRIVIFGNAVCAYTCPQRSCYLAISQKIAGHTVTQDCSRKQLPRPLKGLVFFDVVKFAEMGFRHIKLIPVIPIMLKNDNFHL
jgi:hypothetical protein